MNGKSFALRLVKNRQRSVWEIDQALLKRGVEPDDRKQILADLLEAQILDDDRYALSWIHTRDRLNPRGDYVLTQELLARGIGRDVIAKALAKRNQERFDDPEMNMSREDQIRMLIQKKERMYANLPADVKKRRLFAFLGRRGFSGEEVGRILNS